jgi:general stress protein 26
MNDTDQPDPVKLRHRFWQALEDSPYVMLQLSSDPETAAPMTAQLDRQADHEIWFFTSRSNRFAEMGPATATFASKDHEVFARFQGVLTEETDRRRLEQHWSKMIEAWFPGGKNDPDLLMLHMDLGDASIWSATDLGLVGAVKMRLGMNVQQEAAATHTETRL